jgi:uncharacterized protein (DUF952 family)
VSERLFHLVPAPLWDAHRARGGAWAPASLGTEGFVHLSTAEQLAGTLGVHFAAHAAVWLLEVELAPDDPALRREVSRDGMRFPHLYRALGPAEFVGSWLLERQPGNEWSLPALGVLPSEDDPRGQAPLC